MTHRVEGPEELVGGAARRDHHARHEADVEADAEAGHHAVVVLDGHARLDEHACFGLGWVGVCTGSVGGWAMFGCFIRLSFCSIKS